MKASLCRAWHKEVFCYFGKLTDVNEMLRLVLVESGEGGTNYVISDIV